MANQQHSGKLYIVATPIGHPRDITLRALDILKSADAVICEELRLGSKLLHQLGIENDLIPLNEHNETIEAQNILMRIAKGETMAIISDAGTPVFADPGQHLLELLYQAGIPVSPVPGPASLMAALSLCDFSIERFIFAGFPPRKTELREKFIARYKNESVPVIFMDTPYRLTKLLEGIASIYGNNQDILLACDLTLKKEAVFRGPVQDILAKVSGQKREFMLIVNLTRRKRNRYHG